MKSIVFERRKGVYLPEIKAYIDYINNHMEGFEAFDSSEIIHYDANNYDVIWKFLGFDCFLNPSIKENALVVHEYNSLSTGRFARTKNSIKRLINRKPDMRVFLNRSVKRGFPFTDNKPAFLRDMGVGANFFIKRIKEPEYDFVYAGSMVDREDIIKQALDHFKHTLTEASLLMVGNIPESVQRQYKECDNITFTGRINHSDIPHIVQKARFGLNLMPDIYPLNAQTATKIIEYCALGLPIVSTNYKWVKRFCLKRDANIFLLNNDFSNFTMKDINSFHFKTPDVSDLEWNKLIESSKIFGAIQRHFKG